MAASGISIHWIEYLVFGAVLGISMLIGIIYGFCARNEGNQKTQGYLLGNRQMFSFPVALSLICSTISAISLIGNPAEVYLYGIQLSMTFLSYIPLSLALLYLYIPVYFNLNVKSAYEFLEIRFGDGVRILISSMAMLHLIVSMAISVYAPAIAIHEVASISVDLTTFLIFFVCIFYSSLGGLRAVIWSDAFQAGVMLTSLGVVLGNGVSEVGGFDVIWKAASDNGRLNVLNFDPDPRTRHTIWTAVVSSYFTNIAFFASSQTQVQRFLSMPDMQAVKRALLVNAVGLVITVGLSLFIGLIIFAKYHDCDPVASGAIVSSDRLLPYFVLNSQNQVRGFLGLFIAGLTVASMSSLSSGLTAMASTTTFDYARHFFPNWTDARLFLVSKIATVILGCVSYSFVYIIQKMGILFNVINSLFGLIQGPIFGIFSLGMLCPWANSKGAITGLLSTSTIMLGWIICMNLNDVKSQLPNQALPFDTSEGCQGIDPNTTYTNWKDQDYPTYIQILSLSHMWYSTIGTLLAFIIGSISSLFFTDRLDPTKRHVVNSLCISPPIYRLLKRYRPEWVKKWIVVIGQK